METERSAIRGLRATPGHRVRVLGGIVGTLRSKLGRPRAMHSVVARTCRVIGADRGSVFLLDDARRLRGAYEILDSTRSSAGAKVEDWPSVERSMSSHRPIHITKKTAVGSEGDWFGAHGISGCLCTPLIVDERQVGMIFWDYMSANVAPPSSDTEFAQSVASTWAAAIVYGQKTPDHDRTRTV